MKVIWDHRKSEANLAAREFDFAFAALVFEGPVIERDDERASYGERRVIAIGLADGQPLTIVYTDRPEADGTIRRIISARRSNRREREDYERTQNEIP